MTIMPHRRRHFGVNGTDMTAPLALTRTRAACKVRHTHGFRRCDDQIHWNLRSIFWLLICPVQVPWPNNRYLQSRKYAFMLKHFWENEASCSLIDRGWTVNEESCRTLICARDDERVLDWRPEGDSIPNAQTQTHKNIREAQQSTCTHKESGHREIKWRCQTTLLANYGGRTEWFRKLVTNSSL